jgi:hypothetical protein
MFPFDSIKIRRWVKDYLRENMNPEWKIIEICTFTAECNNGIWQVYVEISNPLVDWTCGKLSFDKYGVLVKNSLISNKWKKINETDRKLNLLIDKLGFEYQEKCQEDLPKIIKKRKIKLCE